MPSFSFSPKKTSTPSTDSPPSTPTKDTNDTDDSVIVNPKTVAEAYPEGNPLASPSSDRGIRQQQQQVQAILNRIAAEGKDRAPSWAQPIFESLVPFCMQVFSLVTRFWPYGQKAYELAKEAKEKLPVDCFMAMWGLILCFFGGTFPLSIAAYEAFKISGWDQTRQACVDLHGEWKSYRRASIVDDSKKTDGDAPPSELVARKTSLFFRVCDPEKLNVAVGGIYQGAIGVVATLKFKYARTVALGVSIGAALRKPAGMYVTPVLAKIVAPEHQKWIPYGINYACKLVAVTIAWYLSAIMSAVQSGIRGGLLFSRSILRYLNSRGIIKFDEDDTYLDEVVGWSFAFFGAGYQILNGFALPFPLNIFLIPFRMGEAWLQWIVTSSK